MKHSIFLKFMAFLLAACALTVSVGGALGVILLAEQGLYAQSYDQWQKERYENLAQGLGGAMAESYAARSLSNCTQDELTYIGWGNAPETIGVWWSVSADTWCYQIENYDAVMESNYTREFADALCYTFRISARYPTKVSSYAAWDDKVTGYDDNGALREIYYRYLQSPEYTVKVWLSPQAFNQYSGTRAQAYEMLFQFRYALIIALAGGVLVLAGCLVYLMCAAGKRRSGDAPCPGGLNRLPLDIYAVAVFLICAGVTAVTIQVVEQFMFYSSNMHIAWLSVAVLPVMAGSVCVTGFLVALAAQWKMGGFYIWKHSLVGFLWGKIWKVLCFAGRALRKLFHLLPLVWRYLLIGAAMGVVPFFCVFCCVSVHSSFGRGFWLLALFFSILADIALVCYGAYAYGTVLKGAQKMASGQLHDKIDTQHLIGEYKTCGEHLNTLADVAVVAARNQTKSERMRTELITNVSHDIKTPLTSIINYIDLLQKAETPEQSQQYLQVLDRQSQRMKKLIDDLMEMSKATSGNLAVDVAVVDAAEAVNQALGEFADKLAGKDLNVLFSHSEDPMPIWADGRLTWRVLSNLLSNIVKYALPGTRVYVDMRKFGSSLEISLKNISKEPLNVSADELTERFVRGDASRNTEGSGLGLNIAQSLMELQKGKLELLVDGDLFKVTLTFPSAQ